MKISILCSERSHPVVTSLTDWRRARAKSHDVELVQRSAELRGGDLLLLISCTEIISNDVRARYGTSLVIHASDLPKGRGWSPLVWQILEGRNEITLCLLSVEEKVDSGHIWRRETIHLDGHELYDEINAVLFAAELRLMDFAVDHCNNIEATEQEGEPTYYRARVPEDSRLNPDMSLAEQFDLLRVADAHRYPCFFDYQGHRYVVRIEKEARDIAIMRENHQIRG